MKPCVKHFFHVIYIMDNIFCNTKYLFYKFIYVLFKHCCYCFVRWTVYHLSVCRKVNRQCKYNLSCTIHYHRRPYRRTPSAFHRELKNNYWKCHIHRWTFWRPTIHRHFTELENNYWKCHNHQRMCRQISVRWYIVDGSILPTKSPTECANSKGRGIKCISDRVILPTELPTDRKKYGG